MSFGGQLARGLLAGVAGYYGEVYKGQEKDKDSQALLLREQALSQFNNGLAMQREDHQGQIQQTNNLVELGARGQLAAEADQRRSAEAQANDVRDFAIWLKKQPIETRDKLTIEDFHQTREDQRNQYTQGQENHRTDVTVAGENARDVIATGTDDAGNVTVAHPGGWTTRFVGMRPTPRGEDGGATITDHRGNGGGGATGGTVHAPAAASGETLASAKARLATVYANATPQSYPGLFRNNQKIPMPEAEQMLEQAYGQ